MQSQSVGAQRITGFGHAFSGPVFYIRDIRPQRHQSHHFWTWKRVPNGHERCSSSFWGSCYPIIDPQGSVVGLD